VKTITKIFFNFASSRWYEAQEFFRRIGRYDLADGSEEPFGYYFEFYNNDNKIQQFLEEAKNLGFQDKVSIRIDKIYTDVELRSFPILAIIVNSAPQCDGGAKYGTKYDLSNACPECLAGARQTSPLILNASGISQKKLIAQTYSDERLVSPILAQALKDEKVTGLKFVEVFSMNKREKLPWFQLLSEYEMPPMSLITKGIIRGKAEFDGAPCSLCGRDSYFHNANMPSEIYYDKSTVNIEELPDVMKTFEYFGKTILKTPIEDSVLSNQWVLVKPKVLDVMRKMKVRGVKFEPVRIE